MQGIFIWRLELISRIIYHEINVIFLYFYGWTNKKLYKAYTKFRQKKSQILLFQFLKISFFGKVYNYYRYKVETIC